MMSLRSISLLALLAWVSGCGRQIVEFGGVLDGQAGSDAHGIIDGRLDDGRPIDGTSAIAPFVISTVPVAGATNVATNTEITATFNEAMDPFTLTQLTFTLASGTVPVAGTVLLDGPTNTAAFTPGIPLVAGQTYTATVTTGAKSMGGLPLAADHVWMFTTPDPPTVILTSPANLATNVGVTKRPTATFSTAMDPATISGTTFTLKLGAIPVLGQVSYTAATNTATFTPMTALAISTVYTATITTGAHDTDGAALAADYTWTFTTGPCGQNVVALGNASSYGAVAGSTVTNTGPTAVTGDVGVSPGTAITGFPPGIVTGALHAGDAAAMAASADVSTAYTDLSTRSLCAATVAGNIGGTTMTPGLYKSTSSLAISSGDLTLDAQGEVDAVFIFQMASTLTTTPGRKVILTNGARAANVYWAVGTSATLGTTTAFQGTILAAASISLNTGASLTGRALARSGAVSLDTNAIVVPAP